MIHSILADKATHLYIILGAFFVANALVAEMVGVKLFQLETALGLSKAGCFGPQTAASKRIRARL